MCTESDGNAVIDGSMGWFSSWPDTMKEVARLVSKWKNNQNEAQRGRTDPKNVKMRRFRGYSTNTLGQDYGTRWEGMRVGHKQDLKRHLLIFQNWYENSNNNIRLSIWKLKTHYLEMYNGYLPSGLFLLKTFHDANGRPNPAIPYEGMWGGGEGYGIRQQSWLRLVASFSLNPFNNLLWI